MSVRRSGSGNFVCERVYNSEIPKSMDIYCRSDQTKKGGEKKKERKLTNELQSIWDGMRSCMLKEKKKSSRRREESETMPTCVLLSRRFIGMLSRVSLAYSRLAPKAHALARREPGTWENSGFSASTKLNHSEVSLNFLLSTQIALHVCFATQWCFVKDNQLRKMYSYRFILFNSDICTGLFYAR